MMLMSMVYVMSVSAEPPSLPVMTAAAVAVGQMKQTSAPCARTGLMGRRAR